MSSFPNTCGGSGGGSGSGKGGGFYLQPNPPEENKNLFIGATEAEAQSKMATYFSGPNKLAPYDADTMRMVVLQYTAGGIDVVEFRNRVHGHWVDTFSQAITTTDLASHSVTELSDGTDLKNKVESTYALARENYGDIVGLQATQWIQDTLDPQSYKLKVENASIKVAGNIDATGNFSLNGNGLINGNLILNGNPVAAGPLPSGMFNFSEAIKDAEVKYDMTTKKMAIDCEKFAKHFMSDDDSVTISHQDVAGGCKINLKANFPALPEGSIKASKDGTTYNSITKIHVSNNYAEIRDGILHLPVISAEQTDGMSLGPVKNLRAGKGINFSDNDGNITVAATGVMRGKSSNSEDADQQEYQEFSMIDVQNPLSNVTDDVLTIGGIKVVNKDGNPTLSDTNGFINELKAGTGITFADAGTHGQVVINSAGSSIKARAGSSTTLNRVSKIWADNAAFEDSNQTLHIKGVTGTVGGNSDTIKQVEITGTTTGSSVRNGKLTINIPAGGSGGGGNNTIAVTGKDFDVESAPAVSQTTAKINFGDTMDLNVETEDGQSYVTVDVRGLQLKDKDGTLKGKNVQELEIEGATITQDDTKSGKAKLVIEPYKPPTVIPKGCYSVLTTVNDFTLAKVEEGSHTIHYQLLQDPCANLQLDNSGGIKVDFTGQYHVEVGLQLVGQNDWPNHTGTFHIEIQERTHESASYATLETAEGTVQAGPTGEFHGKYPLIRAKFESAQLVAGRSYRIMLSTSNLSSNMGQATLDPYKNYLAIDPANGHGTGAMIAHSLRNTLGGLSFNVGYEVRVESVTDKTASPRVYGERYYEKTTDLPNKTS